jgi:hypothetical protein
MEVTNQARAAPTSPPSGLNTVITTTGLVATLQTSIQVTTENLTSNIERKEVSRFLFPSYDQVLMTCSFAGRLSGHQGGLAGCLLDRGRLRRLERLHFVSG